MPGFSLTLLLLSSSSSTAAASEDVILRLLDASTSAPGWKRTSGAPPSTPHPPPAVLTSERTTNRTRQVRAQDVQGFRRAVERACNALDKAEPEITKLDTVSGDGDCGLTLQVGAHGTRYHQQKILPLVFTPAIAYIQLCSNVSAQARSAARISPVPSLPCLKWQLRRWVAPAVHCTRELVALTVSSTTTVLLIGDDHQHILFGSCPGALYVRCFQCYRARLVPRRLRGARAVVYVHASATSVSYPRRSTRRIR